jgi:hypothetical protein
MRCIVLLFLFFSFSAQAQKRPINVADSTVRLAHFSLLPTNLATQHYGFFCRQELKWDKKLPVQLRFRLGSQQMCDRLEGK